MTHELFGAVISGIGPAVKKAIDERIAKVDARIGDLQARVTALEQRPTLKYSGTWNADTQFNEGEFVTDHGSVFYCRRSTRARPGTSADWQLAVKRGEAR